VGGKSSKPKKLRKPKKKCCLSKPRCTRCPIRMLADGTLPAGYTVKKLRLVKQATSTVDTPMKPRGKKR
jgi:hypothetical protein